MAGSYWIKLYHEVLDDPKMGRLSDHIWRRAVELFLLAGTQDDGGNLPAVEDIAWRLRTTVEDVTQTLNALVEVGIVENTSGGLVAYPPTHVPAATNRPSPEVWKNIRSAIFERDNYTCQYCGARGVRLECDHILPVSRGGSSEYDNLVTACFECNRSKRDNTLSEWIGRQNS